jgi:hypothetical protein
MDPRIFGNRVFGDDFWLNLIAPIYLDNCVVVGKHKQALVVHIVGVNSEFGKS